MGAWSHGSFANDPALDWLEELLERDPSLISETLSSVTADGDGEYLEQDTACAALAAAELVAAALGLGDDRLDEHAVAWLEDHREETARVGAELARSAVKRVYENSELRELWDENGIHTEWHANVRELLRRLG